MLDGDPFEPLESFEGNTDKEKRDRRNEGLASLKREDQLIEHVCASLKASDGLDQRQLRTISRVMQRTLSKQQGGSDEECARQINLKLTLS